MKPYPSIPGGVRHGVPVYVFDKLDGSNIRVEWTRKRGFWKFGRRNGLIDDTNPWLPEAPALFMAKYADDLYRIFREQRWEQATAFMEFWGPSSFAGNHEEETHDVTLFDVSVHRKGFLEPRMFLRLFGDLDHPRLLHHGNFTCDMQEQVAAGTLDGVTFEGVVAKGAWDRKAGRPLMFKWKSQAWINKLRAYCGENDELFQRLL